MSRLYPLDPDLLRRAKLPKSTPATDLQLQNMPWDESVCECPCHSVEKDTETSWDRVSRSWKEGFDEMRGEVLRRVAKGKVAPVDWVPPGSNELVDEVRKRVVEDEHRTPRWDLILGWNDGEE